MSHVNLLVFHSAEWDPALAERARVARAFPDAEVREPQFIPSDDPRAAQYGVAGFDAVLVTDDSGRVLWRHVDGLDALPVDTRARDGWTRREFVATSAGAALAAFIEPRFAKAEEPASPGSPAAPGASRPVTLNVNDHDITLDIEPRVTLLDALREYAGLTGTKKGCDHGQCGACTVHIDGKRTLSCLTLAMMHQGQRITTIEGLAPRDSELLHPMQQAFIDHDGFQCGYCTSGQIMSAVAMTHEPWGPADADVREAMSGNICRCGAYPGIIAAVQDVRRGSRARTE